MMHSCCCCLTGAPDKNPTTPYTYLGKTEIYSQMFKECFNLQLTLGDGGCGICSPCVGRLRDASNFKLQVLHSQAELQARLQGASCVKEEPAEKSETEEDGAIGEPILCEPDIRLKEEPCWDGPSGVDAAMHTDGIKYEIGVEQPQHGTTVEPEQNTKKETSCWDGSSGGDAEEIKYEIELGPEPVQGVETMTDSNQEQESKLECILVQEPLSNMLSTSSHAPATPKRHTSDITPYECGTCGQKFKEIVDLSLHVSTVHRKKPAPKKPQPKVDVPNLEEKKYEITTSKSDTKKKDMRIYACDSCSKLYASRNGLRLHKRTHCKKPFSCEICEKEFRHSCHLQEHIRTHTGEKPYTCEVCYRNFRNLKNMRIHKRIHCGEKPYSCKKCTMKFKSLTALKGHSRMHIGPHKCQTCEKVFVSLKALKCHKRLHK